MSTAPTASATRSCARSSALNSTCVPEIARSWPSHYYLAGRSLRPSSLNALLRSLRRRPSRWADTGIEPIETHTDATPGALRRRVFERFERDSGGDPRRLLAAYGAAGRLPLVVKCCGFRRNRPIQGRATGLGRLESLGSAGGVADSGAFPDWRLLRGWRAQAVAHAHPGPAGLYLRDGSNPEERHGGGREDRSGAEDPAMGQDEGFGSGHAAFRAAFHQARASESARSLDSGQ